MAKERLSMRKIKEALRLKYSCQLTNREIGRSCDVVHSTIADYLRRAHVAGLTTWEHVALLTETTLEDKLFPPTNYRLLSTRPPPDFARISEELRSHKNLNLTLELLWQEYKEQHPNGYQYSQFCDLYRRWRQKQDVCMRQDHKWGEKVFVDYCDGLFLVNPDTGERTLTQLFVMVWGASNFTFAEASLSQQLPCWIDSHKRAFDYFGCVPHVVTGDNLKSGVTRPCRYEPDLNATYAEMAEHYGIALIPARPKKPRDKAKVEAGCLITQRWILAVLRHRTFTNLAQLNTAIRELLDKLNSRPMKKIKKSRRDLFEIWDKPNAQPIPVKPYEFAEWFKATVNIDYHIAVDRHYYSVPFHYVHDSVDVRLSSMMLEVFRRGERIAVHPRSFLAHRHTTTTAHMPLDHQKHAQWTPSRIKEWAQKTGPSTSQFVEALMKSKSHPEQAYRACLGVFRLARNYSVERMEAATGRALLYNACSYQSLERILTRQLDQQPSAATTSNSLPTHENIRGEGYYQ